MRPCPFDGGTLPVFACHLARRPSGLPSMKGKSGLAGAPERWLEAGLPGFNRGVDGDAAGVVGGAGGEPGDDSGVDAEVTQREALVGVHDRVVGAAEGGE